MRTFGILGFLALILPVAMFGIGPGAPSAEAAPPTRFEFPVDRTAYAPGASAVCGFDVYIHEVGIFTVVLFHDGDGLVTSEIDGVKQYSVTFFAPENNTEYTYRSSARLHTFYTGNSPGDEARAFLTGQVRHVHGATSAGHIEYPSVFTGFGPFGIPDIDQVGPETLHGVTHTTQEFRANLCQVLAG